MENSEPEIVKKYYTAFVLFAQESLTRETVQLHCTHKYLGEQSLDRVRDVVGVVNEFFKTRREFPLVVFNKREDFGGKSVLTSYIHKDKFFPELRTALDWFREEDYPDYKPHITVPNYPSVSGHFQCYALMSGEKLLAWWRNPKWEHIEREEKKRVEKLKIQRPGFLKPIRGRSHHSTD